MTNEKEFKKEIKQVVSNEKSGQTINLETQAEVVNGNIGNSMTGAHFRQRTDLSGIARTIENYAKDEVDQTDARAGRKEFVNDVRRMDNLNLLNTQDNRLHQEMHNQNLMLKEGKDSFGSQISDLNAEISKHQSTINALENMEKLAPLSAEGRSELERLKTVVSEQTASRDALQSAQKSLKDAGFIEYDKASKQYVRTVNGEAEVFKGTQADVLRENTKVLDNELAKSGFTGIHTKTEYRAALKKIDMGEKLGTYTPQKAQELRALLEKKGNSLGMGTQALNSAKNVTGKLRAVTNNTLNETSNGSEGVTIVQQTINGTITGAQFAKSSLKTIGELPQRRVDNMYKIADKVDELRLSASGAGKLQKAENKTADLKSKIDTLKSKATNGRGRVLNSKQINKNAEKAKKLEKKLQQIQKNNKYLNGSNPDKIQNIKDKAKTINDRRLARSDKWLKARNNTWNKRLGRFLDEKKTAALNSAKTKFLNTKLGKGMIALKSKVGNKIANSKLGRTATKVRDFVKNKILKKITETWTEMAAKVMGNVVVKSMASIVAFPKTVIAAVKKALLAVVVALLKIVIVICLMIVLVDTVAAVIPNVGATIKGWFNIDEHNKADMDDLIKDLREYESAPYIVFNKSATAFNTNPVIGTIGYGGTTNFPEGWVLSPSRRLLNSTYRLSTYVYEDPNDTGTTDNGATRYLYKKFISPFITAAKTITNWVKTGETKLGGYALKNYYGEFDQERVAYKATVKYGTYHEGYYKDVYVWVPQNTECKRIKISKIDKTEEKIPKGWSLSFREYAEKCDYLHVYKITPGHYKTEKEWVDPWWTYEDKVCTVYGLPGMTNLGTVSSLTTQLTEESKAFTNLYKNDNEHFRIQVEYRGSGYNVVERNYTIDEFYQALFSAFHGFSQNQGFSKVTKADSESERYMHSLMHDVWENATLTLEVKKAINYNKEVTWTYKQDRGKKSDGRYDTQTCTAYGYDTYVTLHITLNACDLEGLMAVDHIGNEEAHLLYDGLYIYAEKNIWDSKYTEWLGWSDTDSVSYQLATLVYDNKAKMILEGETYQQQQDIRKSLAKGKPKYTELMNTFWEFYEVKKWPSEYGNSDNILHRE